jgi:hypothetical protein
VTDLRPAIPPALAELVMACLAKNPAGRPQTADAVLAALEAMATTSGSVAVTSPVATVRHMLRRRRNRVAALGVLALILVAAGWITLRPRTTVVLDPNRIAIAPFDVLGGPDLALWREGLVDVLSRSLDGAGPLRTVSPTLVIRRWSGRGDAQSAQALGRETGAARRLNGRAGADSRLTATVLDVGASLGDVDSATSRSDRSDRGFADGARPPGAGPDARHRAGPHRAARLAVAAGAQGVPAGRAVPASLRLGLVAGVSPTRHRTRQRVHARLEPRGDGGGVAAFSAGLTLAQV